MLDELGDGPAKRGLPEEDHLVQAFGLVREHEPLGERVAVRSLWGSEDDIRPRILENLLELVGELRVPVANHEPVVPQEAVEAVGQSPRHLFRPSLTRGTA